MPAAAPQRGGRASSGAPASSRRATRRCASSTASGMLPSGLSSASRHSSSWCARSSGRLGHAARAAPWCGARRAPPAAAAGAAAAGGGGAGKPLEGMEEGVVIVDHGSRKRESNDMLHEFTELYKRVSGRCLVEPAHMELAQPTIEQAVGRCAAAGARRVIIAPYFLSRGRHVQHDIPALAAAAAAAHPGVECVVAEPIGIDALMAQLIESRVAAAAAGGSPVAPAAAAEAAGAAASSSDGGSSSSSSSDE